MKKLLVCLTLLSFVLLGGTTAFANVLSYDAVTGSVIQFSSPTVGTFEITPTSGTDFTVINTPGANGLDGTLTGTYTIGAITIAGSLQTANVTGSGLFTINDGAGHLLQGSLTWVDIDTFGGNGGLNFNAVANVTGLAYSGTNTTLEQYVGTGVAQLSFTMPVSENLTYLSTHATAIPQYSGQLSVPEPVSLLFLGIGILGAGLYGRRGSRNKKS